jgi:thymidylate synthase
MKSIHVVADNLPEAWEKAVVQCWDEGEAFPTEYDKDNDPNSRDVSALIHIKNPFAEPRIHRALCMSLEDLEKYRNEIVFGAHDYYMDDKSNTERWQYTYHSRLFEYDVPGRGLVNQIDECINMLKKCSYTRRAQAITWKPWEDLGIGDPACLQRLWFRCEKVTCPVCRGTCDIPHGSCYECDGLGEYEQLNMSGSIRSNDALKAAYPNLFAMSELHKDIAERLSVKVGDLLWYANSFHIYGSYFDELEGFLKTIENRSFKERVWSTEYCLPFFVDGCDQLLAEKKMPENKRILVIKRKEYLKNIMSNSL